MVSGVWDERIIYILFVTQNLCLQLLCKIQESCIASAREWCNDLLEALKMVACYVHIHLKEC